MSSRAALTIELQYSDNDHGDRGEQYAEDLKLAVKKFIEGWGDPIGIRTDVTLVFSG